MLWIWWIVGFCGWSFSGANGLRFCVPLVFPSSEGIWCFAVVIAVLVRRASFLFGGGVRSPGLDFGGNLLPKVTFGSFDEHIPRWCSKLVDWGPSSPCSLRCVRHSCLWVRLIWCWSLLRIGEAAVPGPAVSSAVGSSFSIGVTNPNGLQDKACFFMDSAVDLWCVCETHLTQSGIRGFRQHLRQFQSPFVYSSFGHPVLPRSEVSDVGRWSGVGVLSQWPTCRLPNDWPLDLYVTGRLSVTSSFVCGQWISGCVVYGTPCGPTHPLAKKTTEGLLNAAILRILQLSGPRFIGGDFNHDHDSLQAVMALRQRGFVDVQDLHLNRTGFAPVATCRSRTRRDFLFVSAELASQFCRCYLDPLEWSDHANLVGVFSFEACDLERFPWPKPDPIPWKDLHGLDLGTKISFAPPADCDVCYRDLWRQVEDGARKSARGRGIVLPDRCFGRGSRQSPDVTVFQATPLRAGRHGDVKPSFLGYSNLHRQWFRQLRRFESYCRLVRSGNVSEEARSHRGQLWTSILNANGFRPSFGVWWTSHPVLGVKQRALPDFSPDYHFAIRLFDLFKEVVVEFEKHLKQQQRHAASFRRRGTVGALFKAVRRDPPDPVTLLVSATKGVVSEVDHDTCALEFRDPCSWDDNLSFVHLGKELRPIFVTPDKIWVESTDDVSVGDVVVQTKSTGRLQDLFDAFHSQWSARWLKHPRVEASQWQQILDFASRVLTPVTPVNQVLDVSLLRDLIRSKSHRSATGLDGVSKKDLDVLSSNQLQSLLSLFGRAESDGQWPGAVLSGSVQSLAKVPNPTSVGEYRPVTVLSLVYRLWSSFQSRRWLRAVSPSLDDHLCGNRPGFRPSDVWRTILGSVEEAGADSVACGFVADLVKAYNTLPRYPVVFACKLLGVDHGVLTAWSGALSQIRTSKIR